MELPPGILSPPTIILAVRRRARIAVALFACLVAGASSSPRAIQSRLSDRIAAFHGTMGIYVKNLDTGETLAINAETRFPTASLCFTRERR
jgi:beta-lactamase class A